MDDRPLPLAYPVVFVVGLLLGPSPAFLWELGGYRGGGESVLGWFVVFHVIAVLALPVGVGLIWWFWRRTHRGTADSPGVVGCLVLGVISVVGLSVGFSLSWGLVG